MATGCATAVEAAHCSYFGHRFSGPIRRSNLQLGTNRAGIVGIGALHSPNCLGAGTTSTRTEEFFCSFEAVEETITALLERAALLLPASIPHGPRPEGSDVGRSVETPVEGDVFLKCYRCGLSLVLRERRNTRSCCVCFRCRGNSHRQSQPA